MISNATTASFVEKVFEGVLADRGKLAPWSPKAAQTCDDLRMASPSEDQLLAVLRRELRDPALEIAEPPKPVGRGVQAEVWALRLAATRSEHCVPLVLRVFRGGDQDEQARYETAFQNALAEQGFPAPRVIAAGVERDGLGGAFMLMEWLPGRPLDQLIAPVLGLAVAAALLGFAWVGAIALALILIAATRPALRLHALSGERVLASLERSGISRERALAEGWIPLLEERAERLGLDGIRPALGWLRDNLPQAGRLVACHGDYHPGNLMVTWRRLSGVIDWASATVAPAEFELGWTLIQPCLTAKLPPSLPKRVRLALDEVMRPVMFFATAPVRWSYRLFRSLDARRLDVFSALATARALVLYAEVRLENPWHNPRTMRLLCRRFERYTRLAITLPDHVIRGEVNPTD